MNHHVFSPSSLDHSPRPTEREIFVKAPELCHDGRTHAHGGHPHG